MNVKCFSSHSGLAAVQFVGAGEFSSIFYRNKSSEMETQVLLASSLFPPIGYVAYGVLMQKNGLNNSILRLSQVTILGTNCMLFDAVATSSRTPAEPNRFVKILFS